MAGRSPWYVAYRRLRANRVAIASLALFAAIVVFVAGGAALGRPRRPHRARKIAHARTIEAGGEKKDVVSPDGTPIGPQWLGAGGRFFLGADGRLGRDEMVRLMYAGRTSLLIGFSAALITTSSRSSSACSPATTAAGPTR